MIKQYLREIIIVGLIILLFSVFTCSHNAQKVAEGEKKQLEEQLKKEVEGVKVFREQQKIFFDSLSSAEKLKDKKITELHNSNNHLNEKLKNSQKELEQRKESYKNKSFEDLAKIFIEDGYQDIGYSNTAVNLEKESAVNVLGNLAEGQNCFIDLKTKDSIILNKDEELKVVSEKVLSRDLIIASKEIETDKLNNLAKTQEDIIKKDNKVIKGLKTKNFITTYIVPSFTFLFGYKLAK